MTATLCNRLDNIEIEIKNLLTKQKKNVSKMPLCSEEINYDGRLFNLTMTDNCLPRPCACGFTKKSKIDDLEKPKEIIKSKINKIIRSCQCRHLLEHMPISKRSQCPEKDVTRKRSESLDISVKSKENCCNCCKRSKSVETDQKNAKRKRLEIGVRLVGRHHRASKIYNECKEENESKAEEYKTESQDKTENDGKMINDGKIINDGKMINECKGEMVNLGIFKGPYKETGVCLHISKHKDLEEEVVKLKLLLLELNTNASLASSLTKQYKEKFNSIKNTTRRKKDKLNDKNQTLNEKLGNEKEALKLAHDKIALYKTQLSNNNNMIEHYKKMLDEKQEAIQKLVKSAKSNPKMINESAGDSQPINKLVGKRHSTTNKRGSAASNEVFPNIQMKSTQDYKNIKKERISSDDVSPNVKMKSSQDYKNIKKERISSDDVSPNVKMKSAQNYNNNKRGSTSSDEGLKNVKSQSTKKSNYDKSLSKASDEGLPNYKIQSTKKSNYDKSRSKASDEGLPNVKIQSTKKSNYDKSGSKASDEGVPNQQIKSTQSTKDNLKSIEKLQRELNEMTEKFNKASENSCDAKEYDKLLAEKENAVNMLDEAVAKIVDNEELQNELNVLNEKYRMLKQTNEDLAKELINKNKALIETKEQVERELMNQSSAIKRSLEEIKTLKNCSSLNELEDYKQRDYESNLAMNSLEIKIRELETEQLNLKKLSDEGLEVMIKKNKLLQEQYNNLCDKYKQQEVNNKEKTMQVLDDKTKMHCMEKEEMKSLVQELSDVVKSQKVKINHLLTQNQQQKMRISSQENKLYDMKATVSSYEENVLMTNQHNIKLERSLNTLRITKNVMESVNSAELIDSLKKSLNDEQSKNAIKEKVIEDQINTIKQLKQKNSEQENFVCACKDQAARTEIELSKLNQEISRLQVDLLDENGRYNYLLTNLADMQNSKNMLTIKVQDLESHMENYCEKIPMHMEKQNQIIDELEKKIVAQKQEFENQRESYRLDREQAIKAAKFSTDKLMETMQDFQRQTDSQNQIRNALTSLLQEKDHKLKSAIVQISAITLNLDGANANLNGNMETDRNIKKSSSYIDMPVCDGNPNHSEKNCICPDIPTTSSSNLEYLSASESDHYSDILNKNFQIIQATPYFKNETAGNANKLSNEYLANIPDYTPSSCRKNPKDINNDREEEILSLVYDQSPDIRLPQNVNEKNEHSKCDCNIYASNNRKHSRVRYSGSTKDFGYTSKCCTAKICKCINDNNR